LIDECLKRGSSRGELIIDTGKNTDDFTVISNLQLIEFNKNKYILFTLTDISEVKKVEQTLDFIFENASTAMILINSSGIWEKVNKAAERDFGYDRSELIGKKTFEQEILYDTTLSELQELWEDVIKNRRASKSLDVHWRRKDGSILIHSVSESPMGDGEGRLYTAIDVTEKRKKEKAIEAERKRANQIINSMPVALMLLNDKGEVNSVNPMLEKITGYTWKEIIGHRLPNLPFVTKEALDASRKMWEEHIKQGENALGYDMPVINKQGVKRILYMSEVGLKDLDGNITWMYIGEDVTNERMLQKEYKKIVEDVTYVAENLAVGNYTYRVSTDYTNSDIKLTAETLNTVISYLNKSDNDLRQLIKELATPAIEVSNDIIVMPLVGNLSSDRTLEAMDTVLKKIELTGSKVGIVDITGVPTIDSAVADSLIKTMESIRLIGALPILSGINSEVSKNLVRIGVKFDFVTKGKLSEAVEYAKKYIKESVSQ
jgi:rsbT co-antagonist protein RsbR